MKTIKYQPQIMALRNFFLVLALMLFSHGLSAQYLTGVDPDEGMQGEMLELTISGQNTNFIQASTVSVNLQQGTATIIMPQQIAYGGDEILYATFALSYAHDPGIYDLRVFDDIDGNMYLYDAFEILENPVQPELVSIDPNIGVQGEELEVVISGQNTHFQASSTTVALKQGTLTILPLSHEAISETQINAHFSFDYYHPTGFYHVQTNNSIDGTLTLQNAFTLEAGDVPTIVGIEPDFAMNGVMYMFDVYGENTHFLDANVIVAILYNNAKETINLDFDILSNTHLQGTIILPYTISTGYWHINILNNIDGSIDLENALYLEENPEQPEILYLEPDSAYQGDFVDVNAFAQNTWFDWAQTLNAYLKKSGSFQNINNQGILIINDEQLEIDFYIPQDAIPGYYDLYITDNLDGQIVGVEQFYIIDTITGIQEPATSEIISVYPNPSKTFVNISSPEWLKDCNILIYNLAGQQFKIDGVTLFPNTPMRLNISQLPPGLYFIKIKTQQKTIHKKLIKY